MQYSLTEHTLDYHTQWMELALRYVHGETRGGRERERERVMIEKDKEREIDRVVE